MNVLMESASQAYMANMLSLHEPVYSCWSVWCRKWKDQSVESSHLGWSLIFSHTILLKSNFSSLVVLLFYLRYLSLFFMFLLILLYLPYLLLMILVLSLILMSVYDRTVFLLSVKFLDMKFMILDGFMAALITLLLFLLPPPLFILDLITTTLSFTQPSYI